MFFPRLCASSKSYRYSVPPVRIFCSSSSGDSKTSSQRRSSGHSRSRSARSLGIGGGGAPFYGGSRHGGPGGHGGGGGGGGHNGAMLGMGGPGGMPMPMGMGMHTMHMGGPMHMGSPVHVGSPMAMGSPMGIGGGGMKDYASMASPPRESFQIRGPAGMMGGGGGVGGLGGHGGGRGFMASAIHQNGGPIPRPIPPINKKKDYASLAGGSGSSTGPGDSFVDRRGGGGYVEQAHQRDVRRAGRTLDAAMSGRQSDAPSRGVGGGSSGGHGGRFDRGGGNQSPPSPPPGRDQFGRERDWRNSVANGRRTGASPPTSQVLTS